MDITYNYNDKTIIVVTEEHKATTYKDADTYLKDYPDRVADCFAIGWAK